MFVIYCACRVFFFFKQKTAYEMRISDWSSDVVLFRSEIVRARAAIDAAVADVTAKRDVRIDVHGSFNRPPKPIDAGAARLFDLVKRSGADLGLDIGWRDTGGVCDGNNIAAAGVPVEIGRAHV